MGNEYARSQITLVLSMLAFVPQVHAQRTDENVTAQSEDAFGRSVGNERLGIYNEGEVRGFSPIDAGNVRIEGLYFDRQTDMSPRLVDGSTIRVGVAAQSYAFPSPTGIVDFDLRRVGERRIVSPVLTYGPFDGGGLEVDAQLPLIKQKLGVALGAEVFRSGFQWGGHSESWSVAVIPRWRPTANIELLPFYSRVSFRGEDPQQLMFTVQDALPPKYGRARYFGQEWAQSKGETSTYGFIGQALAGAWTIRLGVFDSIFAPDLQFADLYTDVTATGLAREEVVALPESRFESHSGELRISRTLNEGARRHTFFLSTRARLQERRFGGDVVVDAGEMQLGVGRQIPRPQLEFGPQTRDEVKQATVGLAYELQWKNRGEVSLGVQKTRYSKDTVTPLLELPTSRARPFLMNATANWFATETLAVYASYTEGLEESPVAPNNAVNRNAAAPALRTKQYDGGIRWALPRDLKLIAGVFNVEKPYFDLDANRVFASLGTVEHRGVELSISGQPLQNLTLVAGTRFLDATLSGAIVDAGSLGRRPIASFRWHMIGSADYAIPGTAFSLDAVVETVSSQVANAANTVSVPKRSVIHLGGRYRFKLFGKPATLRAQMANIFDAYGWNVISGGAYTYNAPRRVVVYLATDL